MLPPSSDGKCQYLIFKKGIDIYFKDLLEDSGRFERVQLDLDMGIITQILSVKDPKVVQFLYTQAKPL